MDSFSNRKNERNSLQRTVRRGILLGFFALSLFGTNAASAAGDIERGTVKSLTCAACHGRDGNSTNPEWPSLAGQHEKYLALTLHAFQDGSRSDVLMTGQTAALSDEDIEDVAAYFSAQSRVRRTADPSLVSLGERVYRGGVHDRQISACIGCHGPTGRGNPGAAFPSLAGQHATYTAKQLMKYRSNERQSDARLNQVMRNIAARMTDDEIKAVASYIQGLQ
ncbi:MAG: cytochrome c4 [Gammaproteobacteria bacterium]|nr:MAG: cytochrome c4 [Gammaproteobacteria bacterium]